MNRFKTILAGLAFASIAASAPALAQTSGQPAATAGGQCIGEGAKKELTTCPGNGPTEFDVGKHGKQPQVNFRTAPSPAGDSSAARNALELLFFGWFMPAPHTPRRGRKLLARFVTLHEVPESECAAVGEPTFAVVLARSANGVVLVFNRYRKVWELPGGLIDPSESARDSAARP